MRIKQGKIIFVCFLILWLLSCTSSSVEDDQEKVTQNELEKNLYVLDGFELSGEMLSPFFYNVITENVYNIFNIGGDYNTELKRKKFEETEAYREKLNKLREIKEEIFSREYSLDVTKELIINDYNLEEKGFFVQLPYDNGYWSHNYDAVEMLDDKSIITNIKGFISDDKIYSVLKNRITEDRRYYYVFLPCNDDTGLIIENNRRNLRVVLSFMVAKNGHVIDSKMNPNTGRPYGSFSLVKIKNAKYSILLDNEEVLVKEIK